MLTKNNLEKTGCPLCFSMNLENIYRQNETPVFANTVYKSVEKSKRCDKGEINLKLCNNCGFVFNSKLDTKLLKYDKNYDNNRTFSNLYNKYTHNLSQKLINKYKINNKSILEIGCGDGSFLRVLCKKSDSEGIGFDPVYKGKKQVGKVVFIDKSFNENYYKMDIDIVILRHVFEHIEKPNIFLSEIVKNINPKKELMVIIEVPDFKWTLENRAYWDFGYEHCNYFTKESIKNIFKLKGINCVDLFNVFSNQYLIAIGKFKPIVSNLEMKKENKIKISDKNYVKNIRKMIKKININKNQINSDLNKISKFTLWGGAGKGVIFLNMLSEENKRKIPFIIDINKNKQGKYCPGTNKKIVDPKILRREKINDIIIMNPIYYEEISNQLTDYGRKFNLIKI